MRIDGKLHGECAVFGVGLNAQEAAGIAYADFLAAILLYMPLSRYGTGIDRGENLIVNQMDLDEIRQQAGVDSLGCVSIKGLKQACAKCAPSFCTACFSGNGEAICANKDIFE